MKIHRVLAEGCVEVLQRVFEEGRVLDRVLDETFRANPRWGKRDRNLVASTVFEVVRWRRALAFVVDSETLPALCAAQWRRLELAVPEWWSREGCGVEEMAQREIALAEQPRAVRESVPDWLDARAVAELGEETWAAALTRLNRRAPLFLRVNRLRIDPEGARRWLAEAGIEAEPVAVPGAPDALRVAEGRTIPRPMLAEGLVEIQDLGSQRIAPLLTVEPGMRVIDACAGAGGKTLHLAALMEGRGEIVAMDVSTAKLSELRRRVSRAGTRIVRTDSWRGDSLQRYAGWADRVLIDAPCSGLGTLRRQPDLKWRLTEADLEKTRRLQRRLLDHYPALLREGGAFVYATCSVLPSENQGQIAALEERDGRWRTAAEERVPVAEGGGDGFYACRLERK